MRLLFALILLLGGSPICLAQVELAPSMPVELERVTLARNYLVLMQVSIGRLHRLKFILDTGSTRTVIDERIARQLKVRRTAARMTTINMSTAVAEGSIEELQFGSTRFTSVSVLISDLEPLHSPLGERIDGVLGMDLLGQQTIEIDYRRRRLRLGPCGPAEFTIPFDIAGSLPAVEVEIEDRSVHLIIDTAASAIQLFADRTAQPAASVVRNAFGLAGEMEVSQSVVRKTSLGIYEFANMPAFIVRKHPDELVEFGGLLSPFALGFQRICLDFPGRRFSWER